MESFCQYNLFANIYFVIKNPVKKGSVVFFFVSQYIEKWFLNALVFLLQNVRNDVNISIIKERNTVEEDPENRALVEVYHVAKPKNVKWRRANHAHFVANERIVLFDVNSSIVKMHILLYI
jgi:hypothetical protein